MAKVKLVTSEGEVVEVDVDVASKSVLIKGMIDDSGVEEEIPLPNVKKAVLEKIIQYCQYIK
jgi:S-phase kinase-associated protein 1